MGSAVKVVCFVGMALVALAAPKFGETEAQAAPDLKGVDDDAESGTNMSQRSGKELGNGSRCTFSSDCESRSCVRKVCKSRGGGKSLSNGASCKFGSECQSGSCVFKTCKAPGGGGGKRLGNGMACTFSSDCASRKCVFKVCKR